jgi:Rrf2 family protein
MKLSKKGEYALRAMIALARPLGKAMTITEIARQQDLPKKFLEQILLALKAEGLVHSKAGPKGGYELAVLPRDISVAQILWAVEEPISLEPPKSRTGASTEPAGIAAVFEEIRQFVRQKLETISLQELADQAMSDEEMEAIMWYI